jgi:hypothetical protein
MRLIYQVFMGSRNKKVVGVFVRFSCAAACAAASFGLGNELVGKRIEACF